MCSILLRACATLTLCLLIHVGVWRIRRPTTYRHWLPALVAIFFVVGPVCAWLLVRHGVLPGVLEVETDRLDPGLQWMAVMLLHGPASAVYVIGYTAVSAFSPSIEVLKLLDRTPGGLSGSEIELPFLKGGAVGSRVENLLADRLIRVDADGVILEPRARALTRLVLVFRHVIGLPDGAGG